VDDLPKLYVVGSIPIARSNTRPRMRVIRSISLRLRQHRPPSSDCPRAAPWTLWTPGAWRANSNSDLVPEATEPSLEHVRQNQCEYRDCASAYRSFGASDRTYQPYGGGGDFAKGRATGRRVFRLLELVPSAPSLKGAQPKKHRKISHHARRAFACPQSNARVFLSSEKVDHACREWR
jgi:BA14K-like protein